MHRRDMAGMQDGRASMDLMGLLDFSEMMPIDDNFLGNYLQEIEGTGGQDVGLTGDAPLGLQDLMEGSSNDQLPRAGGAHPSMSGFAGGGMQPQALESGDSMPRDSESNLYHSANEQDRGGKRRLRTVQQQQNNKKAQQRYREKRKMKHSELEQTVELLNAELGTLKAVQGQAAQLTGENDALRNQVLHQAALIEQLQLDLKAVSTDDRAGGAAPAAGPSGDLNGTEATREEVSTAALRAAREAAGLAPMLARTQSPLKRQNPEEAVHQFGKLIDCIKSYLAAKGLPHDAIELEASTYSDAETQSDLSRLVGETCIQCMQLFMNREICAKESAQPNAERYTMVPNCEAVKRKWSQCLDRIALSDLQEQQLLAGRVKCLNDLRQVFSERSRLNMMAIGIMLPHPGNVRHECFDPTPEGKLKCMEVNGALYCMRSEKELTDVLDSLKLNLKAEQKVIMELNYTFVHKVLRPEQSAILLIAAYPSNIDTLAVANLLAYRKGLATDPLEGPDAAQHLDPLCPTTALSILTQQ